MSPDQLDRVRFHLENVEELLAERSDYLKADAVNEPGPLELTFLAATLHAFYTGIESALKTVAKISGRFSRESEAWHTKLLFSLGAGEAPVLSSDLVEKLYGYLKFRHFFRHAYHTELKWSFMRDLVLEIEATFNQTKAEIMSFIEKQNTGRTRTTSTTRIDAAFATCRAENRAAMIYYITAGFPDAAATELIVDALVEGGCDVLELGLPFSDPLADGPTIQHSSFMALKGGARIGAILESAARIREKHPTLPIVIFTAYNLVFHYGDEAFAEAAAGAGADALLVPDLPPEEAADLKAAAAARGLQMVFLVAPTTTNERARMVAAECGGFVYYVSLKGVTGARASLAGDLKARVDFLKGITDKPVAVGFGVSTPEQTREIAAYADGVVIGSALIKLIGETPERGAIYERVREYARAMRAAAVGPVR